MRSGPTPRRAARLAWLALLMLLPGRGGAASFVPGSVYLADGGALLVPAPGSIVEVTGGGDLSGATPLAALPGPSLGQIAWRPDLGVAYVTIFTEGLVVSVTPSGDVADFATGIASPSGIAVTRDGRVLVASDGDGTILDITLGGNFAGAAPVASGLSGPVSLLELASGALLVSEGASGEVTDLSPGGDLSGAAPFASGLLIPGDLVEDAAGRIFVSETGGAGQRVVTEITSGGDVSAAAPFAFATDRSFTGLALDGSGRLLAVDLPVASAVSTDLVDVTGGGDFTLAPDWASGVPVRGNFALDTVPARVPEPGALALTAAASAALAWLRRARLLRRRRRLGPGYDGIVRQ